MENSSQPTAPTPTPSKGGGAKKIFIIGLAVVGLITISIIALLLGSCCICAMLAPSINTTGESTITPSVGPTTTVSSSSYDYANYRTFTDSGISVKYPLDWTLNVHQGDIFGAMSPNTKAEYSISVTELSDKSTNLDSYVDGGNRYIQSNYNANILANEQINLNGINARQVIYTMKLSGVDVKNLQVFIIKDYKVYTLTFVSKPSDYDSYINDGKAILASFQFV